MGNPFGPRPVVMPDPPKQRFRLLEADIAELPAKLEELAGDGWMLIGVDLSAKPKAFVLMTKYECPEPTAEQSAAWAAAERAPNPIESLLQRVERMAGFLEDRLGIPRDDTDPEPGPPN